ncbi:HK97 family phage prohead protease, partial [Xanthomonas perforans]|uniref:HK97 family phage prohead protease n=1 Tax=Xanthomonas perforans TaxID=442694 RepID=UPI001F46D0EE
MDIERRFATGATVEGRQLIGLAAPFGTETRIADFRELIAPGAFTRTLAENKDILALADHAPDKVLGRTKSGTLALRQTDKGLEYSLTLPDTSTGK